MENGSSGRERFESRLCGGLLGGRGVQECGERGDGEIRLRNAFVGGDRPGRVR